MIHRADPSTALATDPPWEAALRDVLGGSGLRLVAQPIIDIAQARVGGYEMLARFDGLPARTPDVWFEQARSRDLDGPLTVRVLEELHRVRRSLPDASFCTVNVEPHLLARPDVQDALLGSGRLDGVVVELTEHVSAGDGVVLEGALDAVREAGGLIAMDDAGQGHSGLARMLEVRPDLIKLDRALVAGIDRDPMKKAVVRLVGDLAGQLDAWVLAEGVETRGELAELIRMGVPLVQGWAVGRPMHGWSDLDEDARRFIADAQARVPFGDHVLALVRPARIRSLDDAVRGTVSATGAGRSDAGDPAAEAGTVRVDRNGRAVVVVVADPTGATTIAGTSSAPADVLRRAMTRATSVHHAPLVCADVRGGILGVIEVRDLVDHLLGRTA